MFFRHATGEPLKDFRGGWESACKKAGLRDAAAGKLDKDGKPFGKPTRLLHDLSRTRVRNLIRAGVSQHVAMEISGHKTLWVFKRYNITDKADRDDPRQKLDRYHQEK